MKRVHVSRNIHCFEDKFFDWSKRSNSTISIFMPVGDEDSEQTNELSPLDPVHEQTEIHHPQIISSPRISTETTTDGGAPIRYQNVTEVYFSYSFALIAADPMTFEEAKMNSKWIAAMNGEMEAVHKNQTWELTTLPKEKRAIGLKWVFKSELKPNDSLLRKKAHVVAKGYAQ